jgi:transposase
MDLKLENPAFTQANFIALIDQNSTLSEQLERTIEENQRLQQNQQALENQISCYVEQIRLSKVKQFGNKSETSNQLELTLSFAFDETDEADRLEEVKVESNQPTTETITYVRKKKTVGRRIDTSKLPREVIVHDLSEAEKCCDKCGHQLEKFGEDRSEQLEYVPAQVKVIEHVCPKYTCRSCEAIKTGSKPEMPIAKSMAAPSLIAETIIRKYSYHLPWYRQSKIFIQDGLDIPANTLCNWFLQAGEVLEPLATALKGQINNTHILQADETPVKVLRKNIRGYMWGYHSLKPNNRFMLFEYNDSRSGKVANDNLKNYQGILQSDGYAGYNSLRDKAGIISIGCWAHCRRHFTDVIKIAGDNGKAHEVVKWISRLYQIEQQAREQNLSFAARKDLRQTQAPLILQKIRELLTKSSPPPKSAIGKAIAYAINHWEYLIRYIDHGEAEIDNNLLENQIRPFAVSRKNWLFIGNETAAMTAALFYSLIQTCALNDINPKKYLIHVLYQAGRMRRNETNPKDLLPQFVDKTLLV